MEDATPTRCVLQSLGPSSLLVVQWYSKSQISSPSRGLVLESSSIGGKAILSSWITRKFDYGRTVPAVLVVPRPLGDRPHIGLRMVNLGQRVEELR
jgi:hypothetical protein